MDALATMPDPDALRRLLTPSAIGPMELRNRMVVAPMTRVSAGPDGRATQPMADYYATFATGGFGLVITEGLYTDAAHSQGYLFQPGLADTDQCDAWRPIVEGVHGHGARIIAQLMHAGALSQGNVFRTGTRGPSAVRPKGRQMSFYRGNGEYPIPDSMSESDIRAVVIGFAEAAVRARDAGFDGVEIHAANGYLLDQFLSEGSNLRQDRYGGDVARRMRLIAEVVDAVRKAVGPDFVMGLRISQGKVNDLAHKWSGGEDEAAAIFGTLGGQPIDYLHTTEHEAWQPAFEATPSLAALAKRHGRRPVIANGGLHRPSRAASLIAAGEADFVSLGRGALANPDWPRRVAGGVPLDEFDGALLSPIADLENAEAYRRRSAATPD